MDVVRVRIMGTAFTMEQAFGTASPSTALLRSSPTPPTAPPSSYVVRCALDRLDRHVARDSYCADAPTSEGRMARPFETRSRMSQLTSWAPMERAAAT